MIDQNFVDYVKINCRSGDGGPGSSHFHRDRINPKGGPDGGDGGRGGHIILRGNSNLWTLLSLKYRKHVKAGSGAPGGSSRSTGSDGEDIILDVPLGTIAHIVDKPDPIAEVNEHNQQKIIVLGGKGGRGNDHFKTSTNQSPRYAQPGLPGKEVWIILELKILADVGLVGRPNAGKSTLLSVITAAKPKIANYEFTTLTPNLGIVDYRGSRSFIMADIPGIIENAHLGKGLGIRFLKHIERNSVLLFMIPADSEDISTEYKMLVNELEEHSAELLDKPRLLAITKTDLIDEEIKEWIIKDLHVSIPFIFISSIIGKGMIKLKDQLMELLDTPSY